MCALSMQFDLMKKKIFEWRRWVNLYLLDFCATPIVPVVMKNACYFFLQFFTEFYWYRPKKL